MIENTKLIVYRPDGIDQLVIVDATAKFFGDHGNAATLADFKIGDQVFAIGTVENNDFVATKFLKAPSDFSTPVPLLSNGSCA